jgi:mono/diheme cytochrome c family protein
MKKALKVTGYVLVCLVAVVAGGILYLRYTFPKVDAAPAIVINKTPDLVKRGEYLANHVTVCIDCHSSRDWSRFSGPPVAGTFGKGGDKFDHSVGFPGTFYARNITSDKETGIGSWTDGEIYRAITAGVSKDGEPLFPVMPYKSYGQMNQEDLYAIISYVRTLAPIKHKVPASEPDFPMNLIMRTIPASMAMAPKQALSDSVALGKYLVTIAACAECHTPQDKGAPVEGKFLAGGFEFKSPNGAVVRSANLTPDKQTGIGNWTEDAFVNRFKMYTDPAMTSAKLNQDDFNSIMPWSMYGGMEEGDLRAIYKYLRTLKPNPNKVEKFTPPADAAS